MESIRIELLKTEELVDNTIESINRLKNQHWKHTEEEHMKWFKENLKFDDEHLLIWGYSLLAYLNFVHVDVEIDKQSYRMLGIGNVCVSKDAEHAGIGAILMAAANAFLKETGLCGLLLCHENTLKFYEYCGWKKMEIETSIVEGSPFEHIVMFYDPAHRLSNKAEQFMTNRSF